MTYKPKIGIDYHGVITHNPEFFKTFNKLAIKQGFEVVVLSGGRGIDVEQFLKKHDIPYSYVYSILDYFTKRNLVTFYSDGSFFVPNDVWNKAKANYCKEEQVVVHIDDSMIYGSYFQTPFCLYSPKREKCTFIKKNISINFAQSAQKVWQDLLIALKK